MTKKPSKPPREPLCIDRLDFRPIVAAAERSLRSLDEYNAFAAKYPDDASGTTSLFVAAVMDLVGLKLLLKKTGLLGDSLRSSQDGNRLTAVGLLRDAVGGLLKQTEAETTLVNGCPALPGFAEGRPVRYEGRWVDRIRSAVGFLRDPRDTMSSRKREESVAQSEPQWSDPISPRQLARALGVASSTVVQRLRDQKIRNKQIDTKNYRIAVEDLPIKLRDRYRPGA